MAGKVLSVNGMYVREALLRNHLDGFCRYREALSTDQVFGATDGGGIPPLLRPGCCPHTIGSTAYNENASG